MDESHGWSRDSFHGRHGLPWGLVSPATPRLYNCFSLSGWCYYSSFWHFLGFPSGSAGKESACNARDLGSIPGLGRSPGEGKGYPLQYSGLENSMDCIVHGVTKSRTRLSDFHLTFPRDLPDVGFEPGSPTWKAESSASEIVMHRSYPRFSCISQVVGNLAEVHTGLLVVPPYSPETLLWGASLKGDPYPHCSPRILWNLKLTLVPWLRW